MLHAEYKEVQTTGPSSRRLRVEPAVQTKIACPSLAALKTTGHVAKFKYKREEKCCPL
jgi:hypothetical protein